MSRKIGPSKERMVLLRNRHCCCVCQEDGFDREVVIHHIDGKRENNEISNLAVLCLVHASMADSGLTKVKHGSGRKLKPDQVREYKQIWEEKKRVGSEKPRQVIILGGNIYL
jgi:transcription initiation factor TFIIIB Brf1 subunit/transcription initiation factor TFIIB